MASKSKTPAQGKAQGAEAEAPAETITVADVKEAVVEMRESAIQPDGDGMITLPQTGDPTPPAEARPPEPEPALAAPASDPVAVSTLPEGEDVVPDELTKGQKHELHTRLTEFLSHFDRASGDELSKIGAAKLDPLKALRDQIHLAIAQDRLEEAVVLAEKLGHAISAALIPDFEAELAAEMADDEANGAPHVGSGRYRVTQDGSLMQGGYPTTIRKGSVITTKTYNMDDVYAAVKKGRLHIEEI